jgi:hypothetical protein
MLKRTIGWLLLVEAVTLTPAALQAQAQETTADPGAAQQQTAAAGATAEDAPRVDSDVKELSGISIIGNEEAPKSLYIVPWQNSEVGMATSLQSGLFDDSMRPLQREVFMRELEYYELSH